MDASSLFRGLRRDRSGGIAILFAALAPVLFMLGGVALDYSRVHSLKIAAQSALDAAVLAASDAVLADDRRQEVFAAILKQNFSEQDIATLQSKFIYSRANGGHGTLTFSFPTLLMRIGGYDSLAVAVESAARQDLFDIEVAMVLDVSGSMSNRMGAMPRIDALKGAARKLIETLDNAKLPSQKISYAIVPFTMNVNIGTGNAALVDNTASPLFTGTTWAGCVLERPAPYHNQDTYNIGDARAGGRWQAYIWPPEPNSGGSCQNPSNGTNTGYRTVEAVGLYGPSDPWTMGPNYNCVRHSIKPLDDNTADVLTAIDGLTSNSNMGTIIAPGVAWGHRVLSPEPPFEQADDFSRTVRKIMIVITDGEQTTEGEYQSTSCARETNTTTPYAFDPATLQLDGSALSTTGPTDMFSPYGYVLSSQPLGASGTWSAVHSRLEEVSLGACNEFKARGGPDASVALYTIAASTGAAPGTSVYNLLQNCATSGKHFFYAADSDKLDEAFLKIARDATELRLTN
jgi:Flp pilus assembly protein TadG